MTRTLAILISALLVLSPARAQDAPSVRVAMASIGGAQPAECFSTLFLELVSYETGIDVDPLLAEVPLDAPSLFEHPFVVLSGQGAFELTDAEATNLRRFLARGGFVLASPSCSNAAWGSSLRREIRRLFPDQGLMEIPREHELRHAIFDVATLTTTKGLPATLYGLTLDNRLALVFSPEGLNDTETAGPGCCCCGSREIRESKYVNANALVYALMQ